VSSIDVPCVLPDNNTSLGYIGQVERPMRMSLEGVSTREVWEITGEALYCDA
jgi:hypothetical protein